MILEQNLTVRNAREISDLRIQNLPAYDNVYNGLGIVICAGGVDLFASAWICIHVLRQLGCRLPIQIWHLGDDEIDEAMKELVRPLNVECIDAYKIRLQHPARILNGWEIKPYAIIHSPFREVLLLDADIIPVVNPEFLFDTNEYKEAGAIFWPDFGRLTRDRSIWKICGIQYRNEPEFETGQIVIHKEKCWRPLLLTMWYNEHSDFYYDHIHGDKETFHMAFRKLHVPYAMPQRSVHIENGVLHQHDFHDNLVFQHQKKWSFYGRNSIDGFLYEEECHSYLNDLRNRWDGFIKSHKRYNPAEKSPREILAAENIIDNAYCYERVGHDQRLMMFEPDGLIGAGSDKQEVTWNVIDEDGQLWLEIWSSTHLTCRLKEELPNQWMGKWEAYEQMPIRLTPTNIPDHIPDRIAACLPVSGRRTAFVKTLTELYLLRNENAVIVEIGSINDARVNARNQDGWSTMIFGWYARHFNADVHTVDISEFHTRICSHITQCYGDRIHYHTMDGSEFLRGFNMPVDLLYIDSWNDYCECSEQGYIPLCGALPHRPLMILIDDAFQGQEYCWYVSDLLQRAEEDGYEPLFSKDSSQLCLIDRYVVQKDEQSTPTQITDSSQWINRRSVSEMFTADLNASVMTHLQSNFHELTNSNVLLYCPYNFSDLVQFSYILPKLNPKNRYWITQYDDGRLSIFDNCPYVQPLYMGIQSTQLDNGAAYRNFHFQLDYEQLDGSYRDVTLPISLYDSCCILGIHHILWPGMDATAGKVPPPFHTKARNLLQHLISPDDIMKDDFTRPIESAISYSVPESVMQRVQARLANFTGFGLRKLCLIAPSGHTSTGKNWGSRWRTDLPATSRKEGEECRDFMRLMLRKDPKWMFLIMEDTHNIFPEELHCYSFVSLFGTADMNDIPFGQLTKALVNLADLSIGVPTGLFHLSMVKNDLPTIGLWLEHMPSWYVEPKEAAIHIISRNVHDLDRHTRPGSFQAHAGLNYRNHLADSRIIRGDEVMSAVEELIC